MREKMKSLCVGCGKEFEFKISSKTLEGVGTIYAEYQYLIKQVIG